MNKNALKNVSYGMYIVSSIKDGKANGQIANTAFQITSDPPIFAISINKGNLTHEYIETSHLFSLSILNTSADFKFIGQFGFRSGKDIDKFSNIQSITGETGVPIIIEKSNAWLEFKVINSVDLLTHTLFFGELVNAEVLNDVEAMTYDYYHNIIKGKSPKSAPNYIE